VGGVPPRVYFEIRDNVPACWLGCLVLLYFRSRFLRELRDGHESESDTSSGWTSSSPLVSFVLPLVALASAGPLPHCGRDAFTLMDTLGVWKMLNGGDFGGALVLGSQASPCWCLCLNF